MGSFGCEAGRPTRGRRSTLANSPLASAWDRKSAAPDILEVSTRFPPASERDARARTAADATLAAAPGASPIAPEWRGVLRELAHLEDLESSLVSQLGRLHELQPDAQDAKVRDARRGLSLKAALAMAAPLGLPVPDDAAVQAQFHVGGGSSLCAISTAEKGTTKKSPTLHVLPVPDGTAAQAQFHAGGGNSLCAISAADEGTTNKSSEVYSLRECLATLNDVCPDTCVTIRRARMLGAEAERVLRDHFSWYGAVVRVLVVRTNRGLPANSHPSGVAFVLMASAEVAQRLVASGEEEVGGVTVQLRRFVHKPGNSPRWPQEGAGQGTLDPRQAAAHAGPPRGRPGDDVPAYMHGFPHKPDATMHHSNGEQKMRDAQQINSRTSFLHEFPRGGVPIQVRDLAHKHDDTADQSNDEHNMFDGYHSPSGMQFLPRCPRGAVYAGDGYPVHAHGCAHKPGDTHPDGEPKMLDVHRTPWGMNFLRERLQGDVPIQVHGFAHKPDDTVHQSSCGFEPLRSALRGHARHGQNTFAAYRTYADANPSAGRPHYEAPNLEHRFLQSAIDDIVGPLCVRL